ncbi:phage tail tape measure protein [Paralimibaculum aggregatum]|uniref:Phage tail tape measure protein n=1 Tax=Paralimibaculum aggregatum TaxID=3036245 RepID=A0ABQ6LE53_9RHOB|nr:phage tail tape measure protein [Limibaculum sp. NKW23]GMG81237.1 phage tail tape measure protein [Limibaculum sp. NKW23]
MDLDLDLDRAGLSAALDDMRGLAAGFREELAGAAEAMRGMDAQSARLARSLGTSLRSALDKAIFGGAKLGDVFKGLASDLLSKSLDFAFRPVQDALSSGLATLVGSVAGGIGGALGFASGGVLENGRVRPFADGGVLDRGRVTAFARGGVVSAPTLFPMRGGTGLMGEAGPEAILPLRRGPDGRLGVAAGGGAAPVVNVTIQTPDIAGFRRSRGQVAAELARAVGRGSARL